MTCEDFRQRFQQALTTSTHASLPDDLRAHRATCAECEAYATWYLALHGALKNAPRLQPSQRLIESLKSISAAAQTLPRLGWKRDIIRGGTLLLLAVLPLLLSLFASPQVVWLVNLCLKIIGFSLLATTIFRPMILGTFRGAKFR